MRRRRGQKRGEFKGVILEEKNSKASRVIWLGARWTFPSWRKDVERCDLVFPIYMPKSLYTNVDDQSQLPCCDGALWAIWYGFEFMAWGWILEYGNNFVSPCFWPFCLGRLVLRKFENGIRLSAFGKT